MFTINNTLKKDLHKVAACQAACFPKSLSTKLGKKYIAKSLEWFLVNPNRFLFHVESGGIVAGYCGGFIPAKIGDGSSSGMLQYAFKKAVIGMIKNPFLIFHKEVRPHYSFLWLNIKRKVTGKVIPAGSNKTVSADIFKPYVGLVIIGVHPQFRGSGLAQNLMQEFEERVKQYHQTEQVLSVKKNNERAIKAYQKFGWQIREEKTETYIMHKLIEN